MRSLLVFALLAAAAVADEQEWIEQLAAATPNTRVYAARQLGRVRSRRAVPALIESLHDDSWQVRVAAIDALGKIGDAAAVPALGKLLDGRHKEEAAEALVEIGAAAVTEFIDRVRDPKTRKETLDFLSETPLLIHFATHESWTVRRWALRRAGRLEKLSPEWVGVLTATLIRDKSGAVRAAAARILGRHKYTRYVLPALKDKDPGVRSTAAWAVGQADGLSKEEVDALIPCLADHAETVRRNAALSLGRAGKHKASAIAALKDVPGAAASIGLGRLGHWDERVIATAMAALKRHGYGDTRRNLRAAGGADLGRTAARLFRVGPKSILVPRLIKEMRSAESQERIYIVRALGFFAAIPLSALKDPDIGVRHAAALSQPRVEALPVLLTIRPRSIVGGAIKKIGPAALPAMLRQWQRELEQANKGDAAAHVVTLPDDELERLILAFGDKEVRKALDRTELHAVVREHFLRALKG